MSSEGSGSVKEITITLIHCAVVIVVSDMPSHSRLHSRYIAVTYSKLIKNAISAILVQVVNIPCFAVNRALRTDVGASEWCFLFF